MVATTVLIIEDVGCCALSEAFSNAGIPAEDNIFEKSSRLEINLTHFKKEVLDDWLRITFEELSRLKEMPKILSCTHTRGDHERALVKFIFWYLST